MGRYDTAKRAVLTKPGRLGIVLTTGRMCADMRRLVSLPESLLQLMAVN